MAFKHPKCLTFYSLYLAFPVINSGHFIRRNSEEYSLEFQFQCCLDNTYALFKHNILVKMLPLVPKSATVQNIYV